MAPREEPELDDEVDDETASLVLSRRSPADQGGAELSLRPTAHARHAALRACALALVAAGAGLALANRFALRPWLERIELEPVISTRIAIVTVAVGDYASFSFRPDRDRWPPNGAAGARAYDDNWRCYAALHGVSLFVEREDRWGAFPSSDRGLVGPALDAAAKLPGASLERLALPPPYSALWAKVRAVQRYLPYADWVVWMDADALFAALPTPLAELLERARHPAVDLVDLVVFGNDVNGLASSEAANTLCSCVWAVRNSPGGWWFMRRWHALRTRTQLWADQGAFQHAVLEMHLRYASWRAAGGARAAAGGARAPGAPPWHAREYDAVTSPCLRAHWSLADAAVDLQCLADAFRRLERAAPGPGALRPLDFPAEWPVAWSTELGAQFQTVRVAGVGTDWQRGFNRYWPQLKGTMGNRLVRNGSLAPGAAAHPRLVAHSKTGRAYPFMTLYHRGAGVRLAAECPVELACVDARAFIDGAFLADDAHAYRLPAVPAGSSCLRGRAPGTRLNSALERLRARVRTMLAYERGRSAPPRRPRDQWPPEDAVRDGS